MGVDTRLFIKKEDLQKLEFFELMRLYNEFHGRWNYCIENRFKMESSDVIRVSDIIQHLASTDEVSNDNRSLILRYKDLDIFFCPDYSNYKEEGYVDLWEFVHNFWNEFRNMKASSPRDEK